MDILIDFKSLKIDKEQLQVVLGADLHNVQHVKPCLVFAADVHNVLEQFLARKISKEFVLDWVNIVWFTDLFEYNETESDCIASVMNELELLDEQEFLAEDFSEMLCCLKNNCEFR